jgi:hypothetical protein
MADLILTTGAEIQGTVKLETPDSTGAIEVTQLHAPRLANLSGKTICELSNGAWEHVIPAPEIMTRFCDFSREHQFSY